MSDRKRNLAKLRKRKKEITALNIENMNLMDKWHEAHFYHSGEELKNICSKIQSAINKKTEKLIALQYEASFIQQKIDESKQMR